MHSPFSPFASPHRLVEAAEHGLAQHGQLVGMVQEAPAVRRPDARVAGAATPRPDRSGVTGPRRDQADAASPTPFPARLRLPPCRSPRAAGSSPTTRVGPQVNAR